jgi:glycosyltransferase involved in cell wall biosynthesis
VHPLRVLHCPALVGGHAAGLAQGERELGLDSHTLALEEPPYGYEADQVLFPRGAGPFERERRRWAFVLGQLRSFDVVHFNFGSTLMPAGHPDAHPVSRLYASLVRGLDVRLLSRRTAVFVTYQGDDARQDAPRFAVLPPGYFEPRSDAAKRRAIRRLTGRADGVFALNPDLLDVLPPSASFLPYASVDPSAWKPVPSSTGRSAVVVHAPTDRAVKGTEHVVRAIERLREGGMAIELVLVEGVTRVEARRALERADVVVDQLLTGWYGGIAVEAMALAKPVVAHLEPDDVARVPAELAEEIPIVRATPETVESVLRDLLSRRERLAELGRAGRKFVEHWHDPRRVAQTTHDAYVSALRRRAITTTSTNPPST